VHDSGHGSEWDRTIAIPPGESQVFHTPIFGLRPSDYSHYFRIEFRDAHNRSRWTPEFELCAVSAPSCTCPAVGAKAADGRTSRQACAAVPQASLGKKDIPGGISLVCR
jgi:hypothetical protein